MMLPLPVRCRRAPSDPGVHTLTASCVAGVGCFDCTREGALLAPDVPRPNASMSGKRTECAPLEMGLGVELVLPMEANETRLSCFNMKEGAEPSSLHTEYVGDPSGLRPVAEPVDMASCVASTPKSLKNLSSEFGAKLLMGECALSAARCCNGSRTALVSTVACCE